MCRSRWRGFLCSCHVPAEPVRSRAVPPGADLLVPLISLSIDMPRGALPAMPAPRQSLVGHGRWIRRVTGRRHRGRPGPATVARTRSGERHGPHTVILAGGVHDGGPILGAQVLVVV